MREILKDTRIQRLFIANTMGSVGSGITIFAIPWLLVHRPDGNASFRTITVITTVALMLVMPSYGAWIDRHSRKMALLAGEAWGFTATLSMALLGIALGRFGTWQLMTIYFCGMSYYTLHYPAKFAFIQQIVPREQYQSLMGLLEVQGQIAMMIAGGLGAMLVDRVPLWSILLFDASTYLFSFWLQASIPYQATHLKAEPPPGEARPGALTNILAGWRWLKARPALALFLGCSLMPFIIVMVSNYLFPIYVSQTMHASSSLYGLGEIGFALGAMAAGAFLPRLLAQARAYPAVVGCVTTFIAGLAMILCFRVPLAYALATLLMGFGTAGSRVARGTLMLHLVPPEVMGRVGIFYTIFDRMLRTALVCAMVVIDWWGPPAGFAVLFVIALAALAGIRVARGGVETPLAVPVPV